MDVFIGWTIIAALIIGIFTLGVTFPLFGIACGVVGLCSMCCNCKGTN